MSNLNNESLEFLFHPHSIALVGITTANPEHWTRTFLDSILEFKFEGPIYLVNPKGFEEKPQETSETDYNPGMETHLILIPYTALGLAILLSLLFLFFASIFGSKKTKTFGKKDTTSIAE